MVRMKVLLFPLVPLCFLFCSLECSYRYNEGGNLIVYGNASGSSWGNYYVQYKQNRRTLCSGPVCPNDEYLTIDFCSNDFLNPTCQDGVLVCFSGQLDSEFTGESKAKSQFHINKDVTSENEARNQCLNVPKPLWAYGSPRDRPRHGLWIYPELSADEGKLAIKIQTSLSDGTIAIPLPGGAQRGVCVRIEFGNETSLVTSLKYKTEDTWLPIAVSSDIPDLANGRLLNEASDVFSFLFVDFARVFTRKPMFYVRSPPAACDITANFAGPNFETFLAQDLEPLLAHSNADIPKHLAKHVQLDEFGYVRNIFFGNGANWTNVTLLTNSQDSLIFYWLYPADKTCVKENQYLNKMEMFYNSAPIPNENEIPVCRLSLSWRPETAIAGAIKKTLASKKFNAGVTFEGARIGVTDLEHLNQNELEWEDAYCPLKNRKANDTHFFMTLKISPFKYQAGGDDPPKAPLCKDLTMQFVADFKYKLVLIEQLGNY